MCKVSYALQYNIIKPCTIYEPCYGISSYRTWHSPFIRFEQLCITVLHPENSFINAYICVVNFDKNGCLIVKHLGSWWSLLLEINICYNVQYSMTNHATLFWYLIPRSMQWQDKLFHNIHAFNLIYWQGASFMLIVSILCSIFYSVKSSITNTFLSNFAKTKKAFLHWNTCTCIRRFMPYTRHCSLKNLIQFSIGYLDVSFAITVVFDKNVHNSSWAHTCIQLRHLWSVLVARILFILYM